MVRCDIEAPPPPATGSPFGCSITLAVIVAHSRMLHYLYVHTQSSKTFYYAVPRGGGVAANDPNLLVCVTPSIS